MKDLIKKQDKDLDEKIDRALDIVSLKDEKMTMKDEEENTIVKIRYKAIAKKFIKQTVSKVRKETAEYVCDKMIGKRKRAHWDKDSGKANRTVGYNERIFEEKETKQQILKELL